jgi:predicted HTH transcriptional regulator
VLGIPLAELETVKRWLGEIAQQLITPPLDMRTQHLDLPDATGLPQPVVVVTIPQSLWVHRSPNGYFRRVGQAKREMAPDYLARLFQRRSQVRLIRFEEQPVPGVDVEALDPLLMNGFVREGEGEPLAQLKRLHLVADDHGQMRPTVAGIPVCTRRPTQWMPAACIQAVAHRDYSMATARIRLHMFADRMEISSPGALPNTLTIDAMREVSIPRNEIITSLFARYFQVPAGYGRQYLMDRRGAGVDIILDESERLSGRLPLYENLADVELRLTLFAAFAPDELPIQ